MKKCMFDKKGQSCPIMEISNEEKDNYCHICKARCIDENSLIRRFGPLIDRASSPVRAKLSKEMRSYACRNVKLVRLGIDHYIIKNMMKQHEHDFITLGNVVGVEANILTGILKGEPTSQQAAKVICEELKCEYKETFIVINMS